MPTTIAALEAKFNVKVKKTIKWGTSVLENSHGIYIISTNSDTHYLPSNISSISFDENQLNEWRKNAPNMQLDNEQVTNESLQKRLTQFWLSDETILYIGKAERQTLSKRVHQYYNHKVGKISNHKGGYWLKTLSNLNELYVHLIPTNDSHNIEKQMLQYFIDNVSNQSKNSLIDKELCLPFANLQLRSRIVKKHGLEKHYQ